jgi:predicted helicase
MTATPHTIHTILDQFREDALHLRDLGDKFERLILRYLQVDPQYKEHYSNVWMWQDFPLRGSMPDTGIDLVAQEAATGNYCAIQCKFYLPEHTLSKADIDSFFTAAGKEIFSTMMIVSTTDKWSKNAEDALKGQSKPITRLRVQDLENSPVDWSYFDSSKPSDMTLKAKKTPREHQRLAIEKIVEGFAEHDRGKLIMACGTGKTFTALALSEQMATGGMVLFLVPSLALLGQTLREWTAESNVIIHGLAVCSDANIGVKKTKANEDHADITTTDLAFPATTSSAQIVKQYYNLQALIKKSPDQPQMTVVFSTYQSLLAVSKAQEAGLPEFDLIICDEAHRTTGVTLSTDDESEFVKIHDAKVIKGNKRLYMTATPRIYSDDTKVKAKENQAELCSMDDEKLFGPEFFRLGFGEAVGKGLLSDYKVLVLGVYEQYLDKAFQKLITDEDNELKLDDVVRIIGCWNGLSKHVQPDSEVFEAIKTDPGYMRKAVAFANTIANSKQFVKQFAEVLQAYKSTHPDQDDMLHCELDHVDGTFNALERNNRIDWLKAPTPENECRILSNARCLSEGVDVPALDAVLFLNPRKSVIDVVQSVGRVMRRADNKKYGYIILPIGIPADLSPEDALRDNEKYKVVWQVLQALRAHDDRFNATINQIDLNHKKPTQIGFIGVGGPGDEPKNTGDGKPGTKPVQPQFQFPHLEEWKEAIYAKIVIKCGDRKYWETWAKDVAGIAERQVNRIRYLLDSDNEEKKEAFAEFLAGLRHNLNPSITRDDAIEMLAQHLITKPVFDALFSHSAFTAKNPVSVSMQKMLDALSDQALEKEMESLNKFYESVRERASGIDNPEGRQRIVIELYDKFFRTAFPKVAERLGIVYTPIEVVDFIIHSVQDVLKEEFGTEIGGKDVHIIDPFTGTGTFIVRLLQSGLVSKEDLLRKYTTELHANEIILLAYYIAAINIEEAFHRLHLDSLDLSKGEDSEYLPFEGIVLTDTFQLYEDQKSTDEFTFPENSQRVKKQKASTIRVVIGNPPYSAGQESENDGNKAMRYPSLDNRIRETYAVASTANLLKSLYDSYVLALRWASDRIQGKGVVAFVTNGSFIDGNAMDGVRQCLTGEFSKLYVYNLRGNQRTQGEISRMEGGKIFGSGSRAGIAISILIKNPEHTGACELFYRDIGDYLSREEKLSTIKEQSSIQGLTEKEGWLKLQPNKQNDWINLRDPAFEKFIPLGDKDDPKSEKFFSNYSQGILTSRDKWCYNFSKEEMLSHLHGMVEFYNAESSRISDLVESIRAKDVVAFVEQNLNNDPKQISWSGNLKGGISDGIMLNLEEENAVTGVYRPFCKLSLYFDRNFNERVYQIPKLFPTPLHQNLIIAVDSRGSTKEFSVLISSLIPDYEMISKGQCFPLYVYEPIETEGKDKSKQTQGALMEDDPEVVIVDGYRRKSAITDAILNKFHRAYESKITKEDIFYYVYGTLHSPEYRSRFASDLKKMLPRIPLTIETEDFWKFSQAGRDLAFWHLNYETVQPYLCDEVWNTLEMGEDNDYIVSKMQFGRMVKAIDKSRIIYNSKVTLEKIPLEAYDYVVNGRSAIEWVMERYQVTIDKDSGIKNDPNDWAKEHNDPRYILDLVRRVITVSLETMKIVKTLPALNERVDD